MSFFIFLSYNFYQHKKLAIAKILNKEKRKKYYSFKYQRNFWYTHLTAFKFAPANMESAVY